MLKNKNAHEQTNKWTNEQTNKIHTTDRQINTQQINTGTAEKGHPTMVAFTKASPPRALSHVKQEKWQRLPVEENGNVRGRVRRARRTKREMP